MVLASMKVLQYPSTAAYCSTTAYYSTAAYWSTALVLRHKAQIWFLVFIPPGRMKGTFVFGIVNQEYIFCLVLSFNSTPLTSVSL